jgi:hypothetical protein
MKVTGVVVLLTPTEVARGKRKLLSRKKRTREERDAEEALAVARAAYRAEKGDRNSGILIARLIIESMRKKGACTFRFILTDKRHKQTYQT